MAIIKNIYLEDLCRMSQKGLKKHCTRMLGIAGYEPIVADGFVYAQGTFPVLLVAHMDTVHDKPIKKIRRNDNGTISSPQGIGGDDRCGIYAILKIIKEIPCSVLFTEDEEIGCIGAKKFTKTKLCQDLVGQFNYIIEFDRRGSTDAVYYDCDNKEFCDFISNAGYFKKAWGSCSDISTIAPALKTAAVNLSSGYYSAHTTKEYINIEELEETIVQAKVILGQECEAPFEYIERKWTYNKSKYNYSSYDDDGFDWDYWYYMHGIEPYGNTKKTKKTSPANYDSTQAYTTYKRADYSRLNTKSIMDYILATKEVFDFVQSMNPLADTVYRFLYEDPDLFDYMCIDVLAWNEDEAVGALLKAYSYLTFDCICSITKVADYNETTESQASSSEEDGDCEEQNFMSPNGKDLALVTI